ncbi:MAG: hypothetical protein ACRC2T_04755, partial [Thermoguttaceae bacterium]
MKKYKYIISLLALFVMVPLCAAADVDSLISDTTFMVAHTNVKNLNIKTPYANNPENLEAVIQQLGFDEKSSRGITRELKRCSEKGERKINSYISFLTQKCGVTDIYAFGYFDTATESPMFFLAIPTEGRSKAECESFVKFFTDVTTY